jgi:hypothetical protein
MHIYIYIYIYIYIHTYKLSKYNTRKLNQGTQFRVSDTKQLLHSMAIGLQYSNRQQELDSKVYVRSHDKGRK